MAEGGPLEVKGKGDAVGLQVGGQLVQNIQEAYQSVGIKALRGGKQFDAVKGTVENAVGINGKQFHIISPSAGFPAV